MKELLTTTRNKLHKVRAGYVALTLLLGLANVPSHAAVSFRSAASAGSSTSGITHVAVGNADNANGGNVVPTLPAGIQAGDLLICVVESHDTVAHTTATAGWTRLYNLIVGTGGGQSASVFWKIALGGDANPTITHTAGNGIVARCSAFRGVDNITPFDVTYAAGHSAYSTSDLTVETGSFTNVTNNSMILLAAHVNNDLGGPSVTTTGGLTWSTSFFSTTTSGNDGAVGLFYALDATAGALGPLQVTGTSQPGESHGTLIALRPAPVSLTINKPAGTVTADVMIASVTVTPSTVTVTPPVGWTQITGSPIVQGTANSSRLATFYRIAGVGEPASYTWTFSASHNGVVGGILSFSGVDNTAPIDAQSGTTTSGLTHVAPTVTTTLNSGMLVTVHELASSATWAPPGGMTEAVDVASLAANNANGISMEINWEVRATAGATGTRTATASANGDSGAVHSISLKPTPLTCFTDNFNRADGPPGADWVVSNISGTFGNPVIFSNRLRMTNASAAVSTMATLQRLFPGAGNRIEVEFDHYAYGGSGADGIALVFSDSAVPSVPGAFGGSLGYAQKSNPGSDCTVPGGCPGFAGGWLGVGVDEFGNFSNPSEGRIGGPGARQDSIAVRGSGAGLAGYTYHAGTAANLVPQVDNNGAAAPPHRYRVIVDHSNSVNAFVSVERDTTGGGASYTTLVAPYDAKAQAGQAAVPTGWLISYTGSTGGATNIHEIDNLSVCATALTSLSGIHHFDITVAPSASTCAAQNVTIVAKDISNSILPNYNGSVTITTSSAHGNWSVVSAAGTFSNGAADDGAATYTFVAGDGGDITLALANTHADDLTINVTDTIVPSSSSTSLTTSFRDSAFVITPDPIQIAGRNQTMTVKLVTGGACATDTNYTGSKNLDGWLTRDPSDPGATAPTINAVSLPNAAPASNPASNNLPAITFTNGVATIAMVTTDVGRYVLNLRDDTRTYANAVDLGGASPSLTTRPWLHVVVAGNPGANTAAGSVFTSAGTNFSATVRGVLWQLADDANNDGVPDAGADLSNNAVTPSFAWATVLSPTTPFTPATPADSPAGTGTPGTLTRASGGSTITQATFSGGSATVADWRYSEVGSFTIQALATNYLSSGVNVSTNNGVVGRFRPAYFDVTRNHGCPAGSFTYTGVIPPPAGQPPGQPFSVTATALNALGAVTVNYHSSASGFAKTTTISNGGVTTGFTNNSLAGASAFTNGAGTTNTIYYSFAAKETAPVTLTLRAVDADGVSSSGHLEPTTEARSGRIVIQNAYGSELVDLAVPMRAQYYESAANGWVTNSADNCTTVVTLAFPTYAGNLSAGETCVQDTGTGGRSGLGCTPPPAAPANEQFREGGVVNFNGDFNLYLRAPGGGNDGSVDISIDLSSNNLPWLRYDWDGNGTHDNDPSGRATFGIYKGSPRHIYLRERY
jgi:MSHA biogenesis protein MshQ